MARLSQWMVLMLLVLPAVLQVIDNGSQSFVAFAQEDEVEDEAETDEGAVEEDEGDMHGDGGIDDDMDEGKNVHPDAETTMLFTKPPSNPDSASVELPAGKIVEFLVGFHNKNPDEDMVVEYVEGSLRYPMDFTYHIQNFSAIPYQKTVKPGQEATVAYSFIPADAFAGRPIGLTVNLAYKDGEGNAFIDPVFNETVQIVDMEEGMDTEVFFMYVFLVAGVLLLLFLLYSLAGSKGKKSPASKPVETGTTNDDVDYEWIPRSAIPQRTPGSNKTSPRQRKSKRNAGSDTD